MRVVLGMCACAYYQCNIRKCGLRASRVQQVAYTPYTSSTPYVAEFWPEIYDYFSIFNQKRVRHARSFFMHDEPHALARSNIHIFFSDFF